MKYAWLQESENGCKQIKEVMNDFSENNIAPTYKVSRVTMHLSL